MILFVPVRYRERDNIYGYTNDMMCMLHNIDVKDVLFDVWEFNPIYSILHPHTSTYYFNKSQGKCIEKDVNPYEALKYGDNNISIALGPIHIVEWYTRKLYRKKQELKTKITKMIERI
jgi:hypothetical protein